MLDIDHFKQVNDNYGHKAGDEVIVNLSSTLQTLARKSDVICRFGGEEFIILLPKTNQEGAITIAEKIRQFIENSIVKINYADKGNEIKITISIGVALIDLTQDKSIEAPIQRADKALYKAKNMGRNKVCI